MKINHSHRRVLALLAALALTVSLTACGGDNAATDGGKASASSAAASCLLYTSPRPIAPNRLGRTRHLYVRPHRPDDRHRILWLSRRTDGRTARFEDAGFGAGNLTGRASQDCCVVEGDRRQYRDLRRVDHIGRCLLYTSQATSQKKRHRSKWKFDSHLTNSLPSF